MIKAIHQYVRDEVISRRLSFFAGTEVVVSGVVGIFVAACGPTWNVAQMKPTDVSTAALTYAAIAFGFCISGMALVLTLPNKEFVTWLIGEPRPGGSSNAYSDLLFVFSWTAVCHWVLVICAFLLLVVGTGRDGLLNVYDGWGWRTLVGVLFGISAYSSIQFLLTVLTLSQVGRLYVKRIQDRALPARDD